MEVPDFGGYASKNDLKCSDGRILREGAFKHQHGETVPLVWHHMYDSPENVLGYAVLEHRRDGVYTKAFFNDTTAGQTAKALVMHGDVNALSIKANKLVQRGSDVMHGNIQEVSLVLSGANPGAVIETIGFAHADGSGEDEAIIYADSDLDLTEEEIADPETTDPVVEEEETTDPVDPVEPETPEVPVTEPQDDLAHADNNEGASAVADEADGKTVKDIYDAMTDEEKTAVHFIVGTAVEEATSGSAEHGDLEIERYKEGFNDAMNVFDQNDNPERKGATLSHSQLETIIADGIRVGSFKEGVLQHAEEYGIEDIDFLFPDARNITNTPQFLSRRMEWVSNVLGGTRHSPFSRVKSIVADITADEARAKGYVRGNLKKDEIIKLLKRVTTPKTIYKKQKLDRDDIIDITDFDVVVWLKAEMRLMLDEEIAAAILFGDGREPDDEDKIDEDHLRPIAYDVDMYNHVITLDGTPTPSEAIEAIVRARRYYKGTGTPTMYTTDEYLTDLLLDKDTLGRRFYSTEAELASALRVKDIIVVEAMERATDVKAIIVNLTDYTVGADKGGEISFFDDFDIDYNQQKYLIETRISGALTKPKSALTIKQNPGNVVTPAEPTFVASTGVVTIPTSTGSVYKNQDTGATLTAGAQTAIAAGATIDIVAEPASGYSFPHGFDADWTFTRNSA